jgi:hypothetical protein
VKFHSLLALLALNVIAQANDIAYGVARLCHLKHILCRDESWSSGGMIAGGTVKGYPVSHLD